MELTLTDVLTDLLRTRLPATKLGIVVRGIQNIRPVPIAVAVATAQQKELAVAIIGYPADGVATGLEVATTIETAVRWRNQASIYAGRILVFVPGDVDKLGSLASLDQITTRDIALHLVAWAENTLAHTPPQQKFWMALRSQASTLPFRMLLDFTIAIAASHQAISAIPKELWRLGMLEDGTILNMQVNVEDRLERNRELITAIGQLSDKSRKRMNQVLRRATGREEQRLRDAARQLRQFFEQGDNGSLDGLRFEDVERLIEAGKIEAAPPPQEADEVSEDDTSNDQPLPVRPRTEPVLRGQELTEAISGQIVRGGDPQAVEAYLELVRRQMQDEQNDQNDPIDEDVLAPISGGRSIQPNVTKQTKFLRAFVGAFCTEDYWGGVTQAEQHNMRDVVQRFSGNTWVDPLSPRTSLNEGQSLVGLLTSIDQEMAGTTDFLSLWDQIEAARTTLVPYLDLIIAEPIALFYSDPNLRSAVTQYLNSYAELLRRLHDRAGDLNQRFRKSYRAVLQGLLRLDVIFVLTLSDTPGADEHRRWKAILTPLHPLHLWRYRTILDRAGLGLSAQEQDQLTQALPKLPHLLHFVATTDGRSGHKITLPQAGNLETLPIYENRTNRYLGSDGVEFLTDLLKSWLAFAPYSQPQIRIALIDVPYLPHALQAILRFMKGRSQTRVVVDVYRTRSQSVAEHLSEMDFEGQDSAVAELLLNGTISLNLYEYKSLREAVTALEERPVHLAYSFDQSSYDLTKTTRSGHLVVSPLVVTYKYGYDESFKKGEISPSSDADSGLFADYHYLVNQAIDLQEDQSFQVQIGSGNDVDALNRVLSTQSARWLAVADRTMLGYAPEEAVPLVEQLQGRREVAVWAYATSRSVRQFVDILRGFNLMPDEAHIAHLMQQYGHIAAGGIFSAVRANNLAAIQRDKQRKGLIGTVVAAHWYTSQYPNALIASLDSGLARQWLSLQAASRERADLIGLRIDNQGNLIIDIIEVKAVEKANKEVQATTNPQTRQITLSGPAVEQLRTTLTAIEPIFTSDESEDGLFTHARREALKYQLYRECFRELHPNSDQKRWFELLNSAFREPNAAPITVLCRGLVVHTLFEEHGDTDQINDSNGILRLVRLRDEAIQRLVKPPDENIPPTNDQPPPPNSVPPPRNGGSDTGAIRPTDTQQTIPTPSPSEDSVQSVGGDTLPTNHQATILPEPIQPDGHASGPDVIPIDSEQTNRTAPETVSPSSELTRSTAHAAPTYDVLLGDTGQSQQYGLIGRIANKTIALDLNGTNTISLFGVQGGGKSYTLGTIVEMATKPFSGINLLPSPLASVIFHYHESQDYPPEFVSMTASNTKEEEIQTLAKEYGAHPDNLENVLILTSADKVTKRQAEFPSVQVEPILFGSTELSVKDWRFLMGAVGNQMYMKQVNYIMRQLRDQITLEALRQGINDSELSDSQKGIAHTRLNFASQFIDDTRHLGQVLQPGRLIIVDLRDEFIDKDEALGLFVVLLDIFANAGREEGFNKLVVFDEAHKYMNNDDLTSHIVDAIRQMRHQGVSILIASQDPPSLANAIIELSSIVILHRFNSPKWLKHIQQSVAALENLTPAQMAALRPGEAFIWATKATDVTLTQKATKIRFRPRVTQHGGGTKTAV